MLKSSTDISMTRSTENRDLVGQGSIQKEYPIVAGSDVTQDVQINETLFELIASVLFVVCFFAPFAFHLQWFEFVKSHVVY